MSKLNIFSKDKLHIFFENYEHDNHLANIFSKRVLKHSLSIRNQKKSKLEIVNHIGFLYYDNSQWKIAELDYYSGGRVIKNITANDIEHYQIYQIIKNTAEIKSSISGLFQDKLANKNLLYSLRRYDFLKCIEYEKNSPFKMGKLNRVILHCLGIFSIIKPAHNAGWTCIETTFHILDKHKCNTFEKRLSPYELLIELDKTHSEALK
jgi:hypothetical protein